MKRLFGTDGIRGVAGEGPLDEPTVRKFGAALARHVEAHTSHTPRVVLGRDTRESGPWIRDAVAAGIRSRGGEAVDAGLISTPGLAFVTRGGAFDAGVMISASHNPYHDNGLKVFAHTGTKLPDEQEKEIEDLILDPGMKDPEGADNGVELDTSLTVEYTRYLEGAVAEGRLKGLRLVLDCANGSASEIAPTVFRHHGAEVETLGTSPDGRNINLDCGSLHLDGLAEHVREKGFDLGIAFDGDADRALAVDRRGRVIDGDYILYLCGRGLKRAGTLRGNKIVATIMSNFWLERQLAEEGMDLVRAPVGDKYVLERMLEEEAVIGGEQSGHIIYLDRASTGDGVLTGLMLVDTLLDDPEGLEAILDRIRPCPQILINVRVKEKPDLREHCAIGPVVAGIEKELGDDGRVVLRYSGTEPLARVMVESDDEDAVRRHAERLAGAIEKEIGA